MAESREGSQYLVDFELDRNNKEAGKIQKTLLCLVLCLPLENKHYSIAADDLLNTVDTCRRVAELGHGIYGIILVDNGVPVHLQQIMGSIKENGECHIVMSPSDNLSVWTWLDSKAALCISNCHPVAVVQA
jgi:hypothetical protein